jgi:hypothetical protein
MQNLIEKQPVAVCSAAFAVKQFAITVETIPDHIGRKIQFTIKLSRNLCYQGEIETAHQNKPWLLRLHGF